MVVASLLCGVARAQDLDAGLPDSAATAETFDAGEVVVDAGELASPDGGTGSWDIAELDLEALLEQDVRAVTVVAASKREERLGDAPATITVITAEDFARHDWRTIADALRAVPGVYVSWGRDHFRTGIRGLSFPGDVDTRTLVLIDGHPMNNPWNASSNLGELLALPPQAIERVEIVRGPASSVYGSNAFLSVVNVITRQPTDKAPARAWAGGMASTVNAFRGAAGGHYRTSFGLSVSGFATVLGGDGPTVVYEDATRPRLNAGAPLPTGGLTRGTDGERGVNVGLGVSWKGLTLTAQFRNRLKGLPGAPGGAIFNDPYNSIGERHAFAELKYSGTFGPVTISARFGGDHFLTQRSLHLDPTDWDPGTWKHGDVRLVSQGLANKFGGELQVSVQVHEKDTLTAGVEVTSATISQPSSEIDPATGLPDPATLSGGTKDASGALLPITPTNVGAYVQNEWRPVSMFAVVVGARYDYNTAFTRPEAPAAALAPRANLLFKPADWTTLKLSYGEAFRYPTPYEAFFDDQGSVCGNSKARPERQRTVELGGAVHLARAYNLSASAYWSQLQDLLVRQPIDPCYAGSGPRQQFVNAASVMVFGAEAAFDARLPGFNAFVNFGVNHATQTLAGVTSRPANSPTVVAGGGVSVPLVDDRVFLSGRAHFVSSRLNWTLVPSTAAPASLRLEASLTGRRLLGFLVAGVTAASAFRVSEVDARFLDWAPREPVTGADTVSLAVPQNTVEVRAHVGFEL